MLAEQRQSVILAMVNERGSLSITEIQRKLRVSRETIRRDLMLLADRNALRKAYGGALSLERSEPAIAVREEMNAEGKRAIGRLAASLVPDGASVILASGSTVQSVADALTPRQGLTVFTNSIFNCNKLAGRNKNRVYMLGGEVQAINGATLGRDATRMLSHYFADFLFVGAGAISPNGWLMDYTPEEGDLHSQMLQSARTKVVVADHSKFNRHAPVRVDTFEKVTHLVTDRPLDEPVAGVLAALPLELLVGDA
ncbi:MAG TPA: DeoR/GlpR family DNA-binding transcription regulator [Candidatus Acidoferrum sp.]|nr:DeoR/GlpR family DNA-binding transcription regulator [Candidatus Acidoferrum sp.]